MKNTPRQIAVLGAGLSGLSCAHALQAQGVHVTVLDKSRGPGGRMSTRRADGWQCDHGAQYFTARDPAFRAEVQRWQDAGVAALWQPRLVSFDGVAWQDSSSAVERFVGAPRMTAPASWLAQQLPVQLQTTVQQLQRGADGWTISSAEHGVHPMRFDAVLLALPSPQVLPLVQQPAPAWAALAARAPMRGSWSLMLRFDAPVAMPWEGAFINAGPLRWVARDSSKPGRSGTETWLLHASAEWTGAHMEDSADDVAAALLAAFAQFGGPAPAAWTAHRWRYADTEPALELGCAWDAALGLGLCGDWLHGGKVEGAWRSGQALAQRVLQVA